MKKQKQEFELVQIEYEPESAVLKRIRPDRYGSVEGLDDSELANPEELERQVYSDEYGPILALPVKKKWHGPRPEMDEDGHIGWGAFGTIDFKRIEPQFDSRRYKLEKLREELKHTMSMMDMVKSKIKTNKKYAVLNYLKLGYIDVDMITNHNMWRLGLHYLRYLRIKKEIDRLQK